MKIGILHLSDIHFLIKENSILEKEELFFNAFSNDIVINDLLFIVVSGDIAYSGVKEEYDIAETFFRNIEKRINDYSDTKIQFVFCPGNHDGDFSSNKEVREMLIKGALQSPSNISYPIVEVCSESQNNYFEFIRKFESINNIVKEFSNRLFSMYSFKIGDYSISFNSYNVSWISNKREVQSELVFPLHLLDEDGIENNKSNLIISMLHHPFHWLTYSNIRKFKNFISDTSHIILSGHEHTSSAVKSEDLFSKNKVVHVEGGVLQNTNDIDESKFNLLNIDLSTKEQNIFVYEWNTDIYIKNEIACNTLSVTNISPFKFKNNYEDQLNNLGLKIDHSEKGNVKLHDIFIYPDLKVLTSGIKKGYKEVSSEKLLDLNDKLKIIYGADNSGKTTLAKILQMKFLDKEYIPININGNDFKNGDLRDIKKTILKFFKLQYKKEKNTIPKFEQLPYSKIVLIIDEFSKINGNIKERLIDCLKKNKYENIIIFANSSLKFEGTTDSELAEKLDDYSHFEILPFGHILRDKFITKWIKLDENLHTGFANIRRDKANRINQTIGLNIVPSYPMYLLTVLIAMETQDSKLDKSSSYGHYYHFLIMQYLNSDIPLKEADVNTLFGYLSELSFKMFKNKKYYYTDIELKGFDKFYIEEVGFEPSFNLLEKVIKCELLTTSDGYSYKFSHKYIYYYFVAEHLSQRLDDLEYTRIIESIIERLHISEFANILMFVLHLSPKKIILEKLVSEATKLFESVPEFTFSSDELIQLNASIRKDTSHRLKNSSLEESREVELREAERKDKMRKMTFIDDTDEADYEAEIPVLDFYTKLNVSYKLIEILGEIVKNYAGSNAVKKEIKLDLIKNTYGLGLRSLKIIINTLEVHHKHIVDEIKKIIEEKSKNTQDGIEESIKSTIFSIASSISTEIIKKVSKALSVKELRGIYEQISKEDTENLAYELINQAIKLNLPHGLNQDEIVKLHKKLIHRKNLLTDSALKKLVLEHLYMYESNIAIKNSVSAQLDINTKQSQNQMITNLK